MGFNISHKSGATEEALRRNSLPPSVTCAFPFLAKRYDKTSRLVICVNVAYVLVAKGLFIFMYKEKIYK